MWIFVVDQNGTPGHPTRRTDWVRKQLRRNRARLIGGGHSGKPPVLVLRERRFDPVRTVDRQFAMTLQPGFRQIGFAVTESLPEGSLRVLLQGSLEARTPDIRGLMDERRLYRRSRRYHRRANVKRKGRTPKCRPPRYESRGKRVPVTLRHGVETHRKLMVKLARLAPLPERQITRAFQSVALDLRALIYGKPRAGSGYQVSPVGKRPGEKVRAFVIRRDGGCIGCGAQTDLHDHHLRRHARQGSNRAANLVALCADCHEDVHAGRLTLPLRGSAQWRDAGTLNAICGKLQKLVPETGWVPVPTVAMQQARHALVGSGAVAVAAALCGSGAVDQREAVVVNMEQFRRHRRAHIHAQRDRLYSLDGKVVAHNRKKRCDQGDVDSLAEFRARHPTDVGRLQVKKAVRLYAPDRNQAPAVGGDIWLYQGQPFVVHGIKDRGRNLHSRELEPLIGKTYLPVVKAVRYLRNSGMVVRATRNPKIALKPKGEAGTGAAHAAALSLSGMNAGVSRAN